MPRFHFHLNDGQGHFDDVGTDQPNAKAAGLEAIRFAGEVLKDYPNRISSNGGCSVRVTNASGSTLFRLSFTFAGPSAL